MNAGDEDEIDPEGVIPDEVLRRKIRESLDDPRPCVPAEDVFDRLKRKYAEQMKNKNASGPSR